MSERGRVGAFPEPWWGLADVLVQREVLRTRYRRGVPGDAFAGLRVDDAEVDRLLTEMTGTAEVDHAGEEALDQAFEGRVAAAEADFARILEADTPFSRIVAAAGLDRGEAEVFALLCAVELEPRRQRLLGYLQDDITLRTPTLHTLGRLFPSPHVGPVAVAGHGRLQAAGLVELTDDRPWATTSARVPPAVTWWLLGAGDDALTAGTSASLVEANAGSDGAPLVFVLGPDRARRVEAATRLTRGTRFLTTAAPPDEGAWRALVRAATLSGAGVVLEVDGELSEVSRRWVERADHLAWAVSSPSEIPVEHLPAREWIERRVDDAEVTDDEWREAFPDADRGGHRLLPEQLDLVRRASRALDGDVQRAIRRLAAGHLEGSARRIRPTRTWSDLVLNADRLAQLSELVSRYRQRQVVYGDWKFPASPSHGLVALFSGPSGTGKTLAAEIVAADLGVDLFKVDLAAVVSKYVGETEKNLERIFAAAATTNLVLLFDEADALFGKRSEVQDSRDRYANVEVSYLLQRIEAYDGLVVMTTNFRKNIDEAFLRRVHVAVEFPVPDAEQRRDIWLRTLATAPLGDVDFDFVAKQFELSGGSIRNAALTAAFLAADGEQVVTMRCVILGVKREYQKLGRLVNQTDFGPYYDLVGDSIG